MKSIVPKFSIKCFLIVVALTFSAQIEALARIIYSAGSGNWSSTSTWVGGVVPVAGDTVVIRDDHVVAVTANLYSNSTYMFLIIVGDLDLTNNGKLSFDPSSKVILETGGRILGNGSNDQISIGTGGAEYTGGLGTRTGPSYVSDGHSPVTGEGTAGCGCYTPGSVPLPITLEYFTIVEQNSSVRIEWATSMQKDFDRFVLQRSNDGIAFADFAERSGEGRDISGELKEYEVVDDFPFPNGFTYYRIKSVDLDGTFTYSRVLAIAVTGSKRLTLYPNPVTDDKINWAINFEPGSMDKIEIVNIHGNILFTAKPNEMSNTILLSGFTPGVYMLRYTSQDFASEARLLIR